MEKTFNIKAVSKLTGIGIHTIRAWERRYSAITPERSETNRRKYSEEEVNKLKLLARATKNGFNIGNIANLSIEKIEQLIGKTEETLEPIDKNVDKNSSNTENKFDQLIAESITIIKNFDREAMERILSQSLINNSKQTTILNFIIPLLEKVGELWAGGDLRIMHEHFISSLLRTFLGSYLDGNSDSPNAPKLITSTFPGFQHDLGALIASILSLDSGWNSIFLGANLPSEEICAAVSQLNAQAVLISLIYPNDDGMVRTNLKNIRKFLGPKFPIIITGYSASYYIDFIKETDAIHLDKLEGLTNLLQMIRTKNLNH
jgi:DNA-binding transcriptional MerR regulator